jgi:hypothetical protein
MDLTNNGGMNGLSMSGSRPISEDDLDIIDILELETWSPEL